jgi:hypothetical protein
MLLLVTGFACESTQSSEGPTRDQRIDFASATSDPASHDVQICAGADGVVFVAWLDDRDYPGADDLWLNRSLSGGAIGSWWTSPHRINDRDDGVPLSVANADMHCDGRSVSFAWEDRRDGALARTQIYFDGSVDAGETFLTADARLDDDPEGLAMSVQPRIVGAGERLLVAWSDGRNGAYDAYASTSEDDGVTWSTERRLDATDPAGEAWSGGLDLAVNPRTGSVFAVWEDSRAGLSSLYMSRSSDAGISWEDDRVVIGAEGGGGTTAFAPNVCALGQETVITWHARPEEGGRQVLASTSTDDGITFSPEPLRLDDPASGAAESLYPSCVAAEGRMLLTWQDDRDGGFDAYARTIAGGVMGPEMRLDVGSPPGLANATGISTAAFDAAVFVGWQDDRDALENNDGSGRFEDLYGAMAFGETPFPTDVDLEIDTHVLGMSKKTGLDVDLTGNQWWAAWIDDRYGSDDVWFRTSPFSPSP